MIEEKIARGTPKFPIEMYRIGSTHERYVMPYHRHPEFEIITVESGKLDAVIGQTEISAKAGDAIFVNSNTVHGAIPTDCVYHCLVLEPSVLGAVEESSLLTEGRHRVTSTYIDGNNPEYSEILKIINRIGEAFERSDAGLHYTVIGLLYRLFGEFYREGRVSLPADSPAPSGGKRDTLAKIIGYIDKNFSTDIPLETLSKMAGMTPQYFCVYFRRNTGKTPVEFINSCRIENVCRILRTEEMTITEAAFSSGFNDLSYFIRKFRALKGMTPKTYRMTYGISKNKPNRKRG